MVQNFPSKTSKLKLNEMSQQLRRSHQNPKNVIRFHKTLCPFSTTSPKSLHQIIFQFSPLTLNETKRQKEGTSSLAVHNSQHNKIKRPRVRYRSNPCAHKTVQSSFSDRFLHGGVIIITSTVAGGESNDDDEGQRGWRMCLTHVCTLDTENKLGWDENKKVLVFSLYDFFFQKGIFYLENFKV